MLDSLLIGQYLPQQDVGSANLAILHFRFAKCVILETIDQLTRLNLLEHHFGMASIEARGHLLESPEVLDHIANLVTELGI